MSDNGKQFDNPKFRDFCAELGIRNYYSSPAHPQSNGQAEVTIRTLQAALMTKLEDLKGKWVGYLPEVLMGIQNYTQVGNLGNPICSSLWHRGGSPCRDRIKIPED